MQQTNTPPSQVKDDHNEHALPVITSLLITFGFLALAGWFIAGPSLLDDPVIETEQAKVIPISFEPLRQALSDPPTTIIAGSPKTCNDCHQFFKPADRQPATLTQHQHIVVDHGMNDRCLNCHAPDDRNKLITINGSMIGYNEVEILCASCHGTTYRDWQNGLHGKVFGSWMKQQPQRGKLTCTQCHDPHRPAFGQMNALPGPHTLRMPEHIDEAKIHTRAIDQRNPLRRWHYSTTGQQDVEAKEQY